MTQIRQLGRHFRPQLTNVLQPINPREADYCKGLQNRSGFLHPQVSHAAQSDAAEFGELGRHMKCARRI
jgi:hypothetical protein